MYTLILSPHLDDALYSMCSFLTSHYGSVIIATLFTKEVPNNYTGVFAHYANMPVRKIEDRDAVNKVRSLNMHIDILVKHLDLPDQIFRDKNFPINDLIYQKMTELRDTYDIDRVFCPLGIGEHYDHVLTYNNCNLVFKPEITYFYFDYPYCILKLNVQKRLNSLGLIQDECVDHHDLIDYFSDPIYSTRPWYVQIFYTLWNAFISWFSCFTCKKHKYETYSYYAIPEHKYKIISKYSSQINPIFTSSSNMMGILQNNSKEIYIKIQ